VRVLIVTAHRNLVGGTERYLQELISGLSMRGHQIGLLYESRFDPALEPIDSPDLNVSVCCITQEGEEAAVRFAAGWSPDVVYSQGVEATGLQAALLDAYPAVLFAHNYVGTCATGQKCHAYPSPRPCQREFGPACLVLHYPRRCGGLNPVTMLQMYRHAAQMNRHLPKYDAVLVGSAHMYREFQRHGLMPDRLHLVPLPNPACTAPALNTVRTSSNGRIVFLGRLTKLKGVHYLLQAIPIASRKLDRLLSLVVAGDGPERESLQRQARALGVMAEFKGWVHSSEMPDLVSQADLLAVPSLWPEPFGLVGIEAGAAGLPAVAYAVGGIPDWLVAGHSGEIAPGDPPTVEGLAAAIVRALADPAHYTSLSRGAWEMAKRFSLDAHLSMVEGILTTVSRNPAGTLA
jgi:glycosyltransferase involved in cell wall biosynthesis